VIDCVVAPVDQTFPLADDEVNTTLPPAQKVKGPPAEMVGVDGNAVTLTVVPADVAEVQPPLVTATVYVPDVDTVMDCVVAPVDQTLPVADEDVSTTLPPAQKVKGPPAVMVGAEGNAVTLTVVPAEVADVQPPLVTATVYVPDVDTVMDCVVAPVDQTFPVAEDDVNTTLPPAQKVNGPPAEMVGVDGNAVTLTVVPADVAEVQPPLVTATVYVPDVDTVMDCVVAPVDQTFPVADEDVNTTLPSAQKVNGPPAEMVGVDGNAVTLTVVPAEVAEVQPPLVTATVYVPDVETVIDCVVAPVDQTFPLAEEDVKTTLPPAQKVNGPPAEMVGVDGNAVTLTVVPADVAEVQLPFVTATVYVPDVETVIDCVVAPVDQTFPLADDEVNTTLPPAQKVNGPPAEMVGVDGNAVTLTVVPADVADVQPPLVTATVYVPDVETVIDCVVAPVDQTFPVAEDDVNTTFPPAQNVNGPPAEIVGVDGNAVTLTVVPADVADVQPPLVTATVYVPDVETVIDCVVAPVDQTFPVADDDVKTTLPPAQKVKGPPAEMVGVDGIGFTVTVVPADATEVQPPLVRVTVYVPDVETVMDCVVAPVDQTFPVADEEVNTTLPPAQKVNGPPAVMVGAEGNAVTLTVVPAEVAEVQPPLVTATVYVPDVETVMDCVVAPVDQTFPLADDEVNTTLPPAQKVNGPPAEIVGVAGNAVTVTVVPAEVADVQPAVVTATV
jgi:Cu/Ag efflux protein CusF